MFQAAVKEARESAALTQSAAAALLGVSKRSIECWEAGTRQPKPAEQRRVLDTLRKHQKTRQELIAEQLENILKSNEDILSPQQRAKLRQTAWELAPEMKKKALDLIEAERRNHD